MSYTQRPAPDRVPNQEFVDSLTREIQTPHDERSPEIPEITEEPIAKSNRFYVTVLWDSWSDVPPQERGQIILDAYYDVFGPDRVALISVAMGLTHAEAQRLGLPRAIVQSAP